MTIVTETVVAADSPVLVAGTVMGGAVTLAAVPGAVVVQLRTPEDTAAPVLPAVPVLSSRDVPPTGLYPAMLTPTMTSGTTQRQTRSCLTGPSLG